MRKLPIILAILLVFLVQPLASASTSTKSVVYRINRTWQVPNGSTSTAAEDLVATIFIFDNRTGWASQQVLSENIQLNAGTYEIISTDDNRVVRASLGTLNPGGSRTITITQIVKVDYVDTGVTSSMVQGSVPTGLLQYTQPIANLWASDNPTITAKALALTENASNLYSKAKQIFDFVKGYITYAAQPAGTEHSALEAYNSRVGDCSEFTHLFIALARAVGIPANFVSGYGYKSEYGSNFEQMGHAWAYIYLPNVGWAPVDTLWERPEGEFCELSYDHLVLMTSDGMNLVLGSEIQVPSDKTSYFYSGTDPNVSLTETSATLVREVAVEPDISTAPMIEGGTWKFTVTVKNAGEQAISNVQVALQADSTYFDVPAAQNIGSLAAGNNQAVTFDVGVEASTQGSPVKAIVTYDTAYGTFQAETEVSASPNLGVAGSTSSMLLYALIGAVIGIIVAIAVAALLR